MSELLPFFIVLFAGLFSAEIFSKLHLPWVVALILGGIIVGPHGLDIFEPNQTVYLISQIGLIFLMFMAGLETKLENFKQTGKDIGQIFLISGTFPPLVAMIIALYFGYSWTASLLLGIIFISSSVAIVIPTLQSKNMLETKVGKLIVELTVVKDIVSLLLLSVLLQSVNPVTSLPLPVFYIFLLGILWFLRWIIPKTRSFFLHRITRSHDIFQKELRSILVILIGTAITFELLGLHAIIAGFFAGLVLAQSISSDILKEKLRAISYGVFIPSFFVVVGTNTDLSVLGTAQSAGWLAAAIIGGSILVQLGSGWLGGRVAGLTHKESAMIGAAATPQLTTSLAAAFTGFELGLIDQKMITAMVLLSLVSTVVSPLLLNLFMNTNDSVFSKLKFKL